MLSHQGGTTQNTITMQCVPVSVPWWWVLSPAVGSCWCVWSVCSCSWLDSSCKHSHCYHKHKWCSHRRGSRGPRPSQLTVTLTLGSQSVSLHSLASLPLLHTYHHHQPPATTRPDSNNQLCILECQTLVGECSSQHQLWQLTNKSQNYFCQCSVDVVLIHILTINIKTF